MRGQGERTDFRIGGSRMPGFDGPLVCSTTLSSASERQETMPRIYAHVSLKHLSGLSVERKGKTKLSPDSGISREQRCCIGTFPSPEQGYDPCLNNSSHLFLFVHFFFSLCTAFVAFEEGIRSCPTRSGVKTRERFNSSSAPFRKRRETRIPEQCAFYYRARFQGPSKRNMHARST